MADPTIQTFCNHRVTLNNTTKSDVITRILNEFNLDAYNVVCMFASGLGIAGAIYQILPRREYSIEHRTTSENAVRGRRIIVWLAIADFFAALGMLLRAILWLNVNNITSEVQGHASEIFCVVSSVWTQYFYTATWIWTFCYALDIRRTLLGRTIEMNQYHLASWGIPALTTSIGLSFLYIPGARWQENNGVTGVILRLLPNYLATYIPMVTVMLANPYLYNSSSNKMQQLVTSCYCQLTGREREMMDAIRIKFAIINVVFYICWLPNLINGVLLWCLWAHLPIRVIIITWYIMAFVNPLQALFNCLVYRRWSKDSEKVVLPWKRHQSSEKIPLIKKSESY